MSFIIKFQTDNDVRRVSLSKSETLTLARLQTLGAEMNLGVKGSELRFNWQDEEGDVIRIGSDRELREAVTAMTAQGGNTLRFILFSEASTTPAAYPVEGSVPSNSDAVHTGVRCDECGMVPIQGVRYKCTVREDFDLCSACEASRPQPYAMVKITEPSQAPAAMMFAINDSSDEFKPQEPPRCPGGFPPRGPHPHGGPFGHHGFGFRGPHNHPHGRGHHRGYHHHPPPGFGPGFGHGFGPRGPPPHCQQPPHFPPPPPAAPQDPSDEESNSGAEAFPGFGLNRHSFRGGRGCGKGRFATWYGKEATKPSFVQAFDRFLFGNKEGKEETVDVDLQRAIDESLATKPIYVESAPPANSALPKPALRFVRDVTFPDKSSVRPNTVFQKVWRVRNDGTQAWPEGCVLVPAGGDLLTDADHATELPVVEPNDEVEIDVSLIAPGSEGLYTAYFRAQTKEEQKFGQRLWASIVVEPEVLTTSTANSVATASANSSVAPSVVAQNVTVETVEEQADDWDVVPARVESNTSALPQAENPPVVVRPVVVPGTVVEPNPALNVSGLTTDSTASDLSFANVWRRELRMLADMGFVEHETIAPLLTKFLGSPCTQSGKENPDPEGMQRIVINLLNM